MKILVENDEVYAKLNYLRDSSVSVDGEPLLDEPWEKVKDLYMEEAKVDRDIVLQLWEVDAMIERLKRKEVSHV